MNILFICDEYPPGRHGGIGTVVQLTARALVSQGHNVVVAGFYDWAYGGEDNFEDEGVKVFRFRRKLASEWFLNRDALSVRIAMAILKRSGALHWDIRTSLKPYNAFLNKLIKEYRIDIVEMPDFHDYMLSSKSYIPFLKLDAPVVVKLHGSITYFEKEAGREPAPHIYKMEQECMYSAAAIASVSKYTAEKTAAYFNYRKPIEVLYNGIDSKVSVEGIGKTDGRVIYTGSLAEKKGIYQLMKAWNLVIEQYPSATLEVYGKGPVNKIQEHLSAQAKPTVSFKGHVPRAELFKAIGLSMVAVFPSFAECFALGPMEAMACGTAVIYSTRTSGPELIDDGKTGLLIDPSKIDDIAEQILYLLQNHNIRKQISESGKQMIVQKFDIQKIAAAHIVYYQNVLKGCN